MAHYEAHEQIADGIERALGLTSDAPGTASAAASQVTPANLETVNAALATPEPLLEV